MELDYGKIFWLIVAFFAVREVVPSLCNGLFIIISEALYYIIRREHSLRYWRMEDERLEIQLRLERDKKRKGSEDKTIGFKNNDIRS